MSDVVSSSAVVSPAPPASPWRFRALALVGLVAVVASLWSWQRAESLAREAARRLQTADARLEEFSQLVAQSQENTRELQGRAAALEARLSELGTQQLQLEKLYRNMALDSLDAVLADVETALTMASQQLMVSASVQGALIALQDADSRLKRLNQPAAVGLRRLIAGDIERLRAAPAVDLVGLAVRLDSVASVSEKLPLVASLSRPGGREASEEQQASEGSRFSLSRLATQGRKGWEALLGELSQLFRVNRIDEPDAVLLAPGQQYFVRENLRLVLLSARLALLARAETVFRADLERAIRWMGDYYDADSRPVAAALASLRQLQSARLAIDLPSLGNTLAAVRAARSARESR